MYRLRLILIVLLTPVLLTACGKEQGEEVIVIKFPHVTAPSTPKGYGADRFKELVAERLGGRVLVEVYPSGQLMNDDDSLEALAFGEIQMIAVSLSKFDRLTRKFQVFDLPFLFADLGEVEIFQSSPAGQSLLTEIEDKGYFGLSYWHNGMKQLTGPKPLRVPSDASGLKFRIMESDVLQEQILALGANPQKMSFGEVYQALQTGAIDAQENTWSNIYVQKFYEVQPYATESNHGYLGYMLAANTTFWKGLPPDIRKELEDIVAQVSEEVNDKASEIALRDRQMIVDSGITEIIELDEPTLEQWRAVMRPVWNKFTAEIGQEVMAATPAGSAEN
jgi:C4-dicarboxylate-binding protein DctP